MAPREKIEQRAIDYSVEHPSEAPQLDEKHFKAGAEYGYNLAIENVVYWLCMNMIDTLYFGCGTKQTMSKPELINNLKEAMKL